MFRIAAIALASLTLTGAPLCAAEDAPGPALDEAAVAAAKALGESGRVGQAILSCSSAKVRESFRHTGLAFVDMEMRGAVGDIAMNAAEAKRLHTELATTDAMKAWHLTVVAAPATAGVIQNVVLASGSTVVKPDLLLTTKTDGKVGGYAMFTSPEARALVRGGDFQIVAELKAGRRSCDVSQKDRIRLGF